MVYFQGTLFSRSVSYHCHVTVNVHSFCERSTTTEIKSLLCLWGGEGGDEHPSGSCLQLLTCNRTQTCLCLWNLRLASLQGIFKGSLKLTLCHLAVISPKKSCCMHWSVLCIIKITARVRNGSLYSAAELCEVWNAVFCGTFSVKGNC